jgi:hypothetical protein
MGDMRLDHYLPRFSRGAYCPAPLAAAVGHSLAAAHDPAHGTAPRVHFRSVCDTHSLENGVKVVAQPVRHALPAVNDRPLLDSSSWEV